MHCSISIVFSFIYCSYDVSVTEDDKIRWQNYATVFLSLFLVISTVLLSEKHYQYPFFSTDIISKRCSSINSSIIVLSIHHCSHNTRSKWTVSALCEEWSIDGSFYSQRPRWKYLQSPCTKNRANWYLLKMQEKKLKDILESRKW